MKRQRAILEKLGGVVSVFRFLKEERVNESMKKKKKRGRRRRRPSDDV